MSKYALVTGAGKGLGLGFLKHLSTHGFVVFAGVRRFEKHLPSLQNVNWVELDVTSDASISHAFEQVSSKTNSLNLLVNNAGVNKKTQEGSMQARVDRLGYLDRASLLKMVDINAVAPLLVTQRFLSFLTPNPSFIINISSCRASYHDEFEITSANYGYRASKAALNMLTASLVFDLPRHVRTFAVHPGSVKSDMNPNGEDDPVAQASKIIAITENWQDKLNGSFLNFNGSLYPL